MVAINTEYTDTGRYMLPISQIPSVYFNYVAHLGVTIYNRFGSPDKRDGSFLMTIVWNTSENYEKQYTVVFNPVYFYMIT